MLKIVAFACNYFCHHILKYIPFIFRLMPDIIKSVLNVVKLSKNISVRLFFNFPVITCLVICLKPWTMAVLMCFQCQSSIVVTCDRLPWYIVNPPLFYITNLQPSNLLLSISWCYFFENCFFDNLLYGSVLEFPCYLLLCFLHFLRWQI